MEDIEKQEQLPDDSDDNMDNTEEDEEEESPEMVEDQSPNGKGQENLELPATEKRLKEDHPMSDGDGDDEDEAKTTVVDAVVNSGNNTCALNNPQDATPLPLQMFSIMDAKSNAGSGEKNSNAVLVEADDESEEARAAFMRELEQFFRQRSLDFKPPKFYQEPLNLLKLWKAVIKLGGYETVTGSKLWRQVGDSFHPPKTCTTVSWTFRIFYEKALLEFEKHKRQIGELEPLAAAPEPASVENEEVGYQAPGSGRARRDAAARAMQGWHAQRLLGYGEAVEPVVKDKSFTPTPKREKNLKSLGLFKHKKTTNQEVVLKDALPDATKQLNATVVDFGPPADWVKVNVRETKDCFEVYALVPGLLREEVRVQSDPAGRLVITGEPEQPDNPWGITPFKKVVNLPARIDPLQTSAVVSLHGRLFVRVPFEQSNF